MSEEINYFSLFLQIMGSLAVFLYGLQVMSEGLQKAAGSRLRAWLERATSNRFMGTLSGFVITCAVQSSSATTVMIVAFCSAGLMTLTQSLGVIFGANIGTTTTAWLVSLLGFKVKISSFAIPLIGIGFFSQFIQRWRTPHRIGQVLVGFGLLFLGLSLLKHAIPDVSQAPQVTGWIADLEPDTALGLVGAILFGALITVVVQSSSASMAITLTAAAKGYIDFPTAAAIALGQNIGTTVTAALAAIGAPVVARRAAMAHFLFNLLGSIWPILFLGPMLALVDYIVPGDPYGIGEDVLLVYIPTHIAAFHTAFNVINSLVFLPLVGPFERLVVALVPDRGDSAADEQALVYLETPFGSTPELAITAARREVDRMAHVTEKIIDRVAEAVHASGTEREVLLAKISAHEQTTDVLEHKITEFLAELVHDQLSSEASREAISLLSMINDLERIGDHGEKVSQLLARMTEMNAEFTADELAELDEIVAVTRRNLTEMRKLVLHRDPNPMPAARAREDELNAVRNKLRQAYVERMTSGQTTPVVGIIFADLITSFEKMGDHAYNVVEATAGLK